MENMHKGGRASQPGGRASQRRQGTAISSGISVLAKLISYFQGSGAEARHENAKHSRLIL